jgi:hypothetical protein
MLRSIIFATLFVALMGCASSAATLASTPLEVVSNDDFEVSYLRIHRSPGSLQVSGRVTRLRSQGRAIGSHVVVEALRDGERLASREASFSALSVNRRPGAFFRATLPLSAPPADMVRVAIHPPVLRSAEQEMLHD